MHNVPGTDLEDVPLDLCSWKEYDLHLGGGEGLIRRACVFVLLCGVDCGTLIIITRTQVPCLLAAL